ERGEDFAGLSRLLNKNPAYIQQFIRRAVPKRLGEDDRRKLADYLAIPEAMLGGPEVVRAGDLVSVARVAVRRSAGAGAIRRSDDALLVKRLALNPIGSRVTVQSDNPAYPDWPDCSLAEIHCVGRVIWAGRKID